MKHALEKKKQEIIIESINQNEMHATSKEKKRERDKSANMKQAAEKKEKRKDECLYCSFITTTRYQRNKFEGRVIKSSWV